MIDPSAFSHDSPFDPRSFRGHSLHLGHVFDSGGRALDRRIVFCTKCGAMYWERADALCRSCKTAPRRVCVTASQTQGWPFPEQTLPRLDSGARAETHLGGGEHAGGAAGILRGRPGTRSLGADDPQENKSRPTGSRAAALATRRWDSQDCGHGFAALGRRSRRLHRCVWDQRSAGGEARRQGRECNTHSPLMSLPIVAKRDPREVLWGYAASSYSVDARLFSGTQLGALLQRCPAVSLAARWALSFLLSLATEPSQAA